MYRVRRVSVPRMGRSGGGLDEVEPEESSPSLVQAAEAASSPPALWVALAVAEVVAASPPAAMGLFGAPEFSPPAWGAFTASSVLAADGADPWLSSVV